MISPYVILRVIKIIAIINYFYRYEFIHYSSFVEGITCECVYVMYIPPKDTIEMSACRV